MSDDEFTARRRLDCRRGITAKDRRQRHLELVTDGWIAELARLVMLSDRAAHRADDAPSLLVRKRAPDRPSRNPSSSRMRTNRDA